MKNITSQFKIKKAANIDVDYGPFKSLNEAYNNVEKERRVIGKTIGIIENGSVVEYQFKSGIENVDLVAKVDFTPKGEYNPETIYEILDAASNAKTATTNANNAASNANNAAASVGTAISDAKTATTAANNAAQSATTAATMASNARGWTPLFEYNVVDSTTTVKQLVDYVGGTGTKPTTNVGQYVTDDGYSSDISQALNFKGEQGIQGKPGDSAENQNPTQPNIMFWTGTQVEYDSITLPNPDTLYFIKP